MGGELLRAAAIDRLRVACEARGEKDFDVLDVASRWDEAGGRSRRGLLQVYPEARCVLIGMGIGGARRLAVLFGELGVEFLKAAPCVCFAHFVARFGHG